MEKVKVATIWLDGCSGCHMSFLDIDERLLEIAPLIDLVYSPLVDIKEYPDEVDVCLVEGAISSDEDEEKIKKIRAHTKIVISYGDCAVTSNIPGMRNSFKIEELMSRAYIENAIAQQQIPGERIPHLLPHCRPVGEVVKVDFHLPGCPPPADLIFHVLSELLAGRIPDLTGIAKFGA
ncbi:MAG: NADH-quinone oxidoreductase subunit B family protein [Armatimonadota bacterium]